MILIYLCLGTLVFYIVYNHIATTKQKTIDFEVTPEIKEPLPIIFKSSAKPETIKQLEEVYFYDFPASKSLFDSIERKDPIISCWETSKIVVGSDYSVSLPEGYKHSPTRYSYDLKLHKDIKSCNALAAAFSDAIPGIEKILNKQLVGEHQVNISAILYYPSQSQTWSGPWHNDRLVTLTTSLVYFHHEDVNAKLGIRIPAIRNLPSKNITAVDTKAGDVITFANKVLEHQVQNLSTNKQRSVRGLVAFFYNGPSNIPPSLGKINSTLTIEEDTTNTEQTWTLRS